MGKYNIARNLGKAKFNPQGFVSYLPQEKHLKVFLKKDKIELYKSRVLKATKDKKSKIRREGKLIIKFNSKRQASKPVLPFPDPYAHK